MEKDCVGEIDDGDGDDGGGDGDDNHDDVGKMVQKM